MTNWLAQLLALMLSPTKLTLTAPPHPSLAVTRLVSGAGTAEAQLTVAGAGQAIVGAVVSLTVIVCVQSAWLLHRSVARYVRGMTNRFAQLLALIVSPTKVTVTEPPPQLSLAVTALVSGAGTPEAQRTVMVPGRGMEGG